MSLHRICCCLDDCSHCGADPTPATFEVEFTDLTASGCQSDPEGGSPDAQSACYIWLSHNATLTLPGTVCLRRVLVEGSSCCYCCTIPCEVDLYSEEGCTGDILCTSTQNVYIELCLFRDPVTFDLKMTLRAITLSDDSWCRRQGYFRNNDFALGLFDDTVIVTDPCTDPTNFTNDNTAADFGLIAWGGTAVATPGACSPTSADCEFGDEADPCPTDCSGCAASITVVVSGCPGGTGDGTYTCTRIGCRWEGTTSGITATVQCGDQTAAPGIWQVYLSSAGDNPYFISTDQAGCPTDVAGWEDCAGCAGVTVS